MKLVKILFLTANPFDKAYLRAGKELRTIKEKLSTTIYGKDFEVKFEPATRPEDWLSALIKYKPDVVHFSGHGSPGGRLLLEGKDGQAQAVSPQVLTKLFKDYKGNTCLVILNACHSRSQADMLIEEVDCAICMNKAIDDEVAIDFFSIFYQALGNGSSVKDAFNQGEIILGMGDEDEGKIPALVERAGIDASKIILGGVVQQREPGTLSIFCVHAPEE